MVLRVTAMEGYFTGTLYNSDYKAKMFWDCKMLKKVAHLREGECVECIIVHGDSGDMEILHNDNWSRLRQVFTRDQPYNVSYVVYDNGFSIDRVKRRRLNPMGENIHLVGDKVVSENTAAAAIQRAWITLYLHPDYIGGKKVVDDLKHKAAEMRQF